MSQRRSHKLVLASVLRGLRRCRPTLNAGGGRGCSYGILALATGAGALWPQATVAALGPVLLVGLVSLGVAHGACDQLVLPAYRPGRRYEWRYLLRFVAGYLGLAGAVGVVGWRFPGLGTGLFFALTVWHWGSADAPAHRQPGAWVAHNLLRGALLLAVPAWWWPTETAHHANGLLRLMGGAPVATSHWGGALPVVVAGHLGLWGYWARSREFGRCCRDAGEVLLLVGLLMALPPLPALGVYFVFWHSWQHVLRLAPLLGGTASEPAGTLWALLQQVASFGRRAFPMLAISLAAGALAYAFGGTSLPAGGPWLSLAVVGASVVTLPHALLVSVVMDASKWRPRTNATPLRHAVAALTNGLARRRSANKAASIGPARLITKPSAAVPGSVCRPGVAPHPRPAPLGARNLSGEGRQA